MRALLALLLVVSAATAQSFDEWLPESTLFYASLENVTRTRERIEKSPLHAIWTDPAIQPFLEMPRKRWAEAAADMIREGGGSVGEFAGLLQGQAVFAITGFGADGEPDFVVLMDFTGKEDELKEFLERTEKKEETRRRERQEVFRGHTLTVRAPEEGTGDSEVAYIERPPLFMIASGAEVLKDVLVRKEEGPGSSLATSDAYRTVRERTGARSDLVLYLSMAFIGEVDDQTARMLDAFGLTADGALALQTQIAADGVSSRMFLLAPGERRGLLKVIAGTNAELAPPAFLPAGTGTLFSMAADWAAAWKAVIKLADAAMPGMGSMIDAQMRAAGQQAGIDVVEDLMGSVGPALSLAYLGGEGQPATGAPDVYVFQLRDRERYQRSLDRLMATNPNSETIEYLGYKIIRGGNTYGVVLPGYAVIAPRIEPVQDVINRLSKEGEGLAASAAFARAVAKIPERRSALWYSNPGADTGSSVGLDTFWKAFEAGYKQGSGSELPFDPKLLPGPEFWKKYRDIHVFAISGEEDGILFTHFFGVKP